MKKIIDIMKAQTIAVFEGEQFELLAIGSGKTTDNDSGNETSFVRLEAEVPKNLKPYSRCRFTVKILNGVQKITQEEIDAGDTVFLVAFYDLDISYIDSKGNVYFRASNYEIEKEED